MHLVVLAFIRVRSYKHTIYCVTKLVLPYIFSLVFRIAQSELGIVSNRDFLSAVSTAPRFLFVYFFLWFCFLVLRQTTNNNLKGRPLSNQTNGLIGTWGTFQIARPAKNASFPMKNMNTRPSGQSSKPY